MRLLLVPLSLTLAMQVVAAQTSAQALRWDELQAKGQVSAGTVLPPEPNSNTYRLKVENSKPTPVTVTVLTIDRPQVGGPRYRLSGQVRYEKVDGAGYLELWNYFPGGGQYFSRTLAEQGPMMKIQGTSGWRAFELPFDATGAPPPTRLVLNIVLQGHGTVYLGPMELGTLGRAAYGASDEVNRWAGMAGGVTGTIVGCLGALIGLLTSLGRARRFVIASATSLIIFGVLAFTLGIAAFTLSRPYSAFSPLLLLLGFLTSVVPLGLLPVIRRRYEEIELRTMRAHDLG